MRLIFLPFHSPLLRQIPAVEKCVCEREREGKAFLPRHFHSSPPLLLHPFSAASFGPGEIRRQALFFPKQSLKIYVIFGWFFCILNKESLPELSNSILLFSTPPLPLFYKVAGKRSCSSFFREKGSFFFLLLLLLFFFGGKGGEEKRSWEEGGKVSQEVFAKTSGNRPRGVGGEKIDKYEKKILRFAKYLY